MIVVPFIAVQNKCHFSFVVWYWMTPSCSLACINVLMIIRSFTWATRYFWAHHVQPNFHRLFDNHKITLTDLKCQTCTTRDFIRTDHFTLPVFPTARRQQSQTFTLPNFQNGRLPQWMTSTFWTNFHTHARRVHCHAYFYTAMSTLPDIHTAWHSCTTRFSHFQNFTLQLYFHTRSVTLCLTFHNVRLPHYKTSTISDFHIFHNFSTATLSHYQTFTLQDSSPKCQTSTLPPNFHTVRFYNARFHAHRRLYNARLPHA